MLRPSPIRIVALTALLVLVACLAVARPRRPTPPRPPSRLLVLTLNLRAHHDGARARERLILRFISRARPDIVLFQEVGPPDGAQAERVLPKGYTVVARQNPDTGRGLAIASRYPITSYRDVVLPVRGRPALGAVIDLKGRPLAVVNVHLTPELGASATRIKELARARALLDELAGDGPPGDGLLGGDVNFGDGAPEQAGLKGLVDAYRARHRRTPGFTWDIKRNPLAARNGYADEPSRRLDRILLRGKLRPLRADVVLSRPGKGPKGEKVFASDHFGLLVRLALTPPRHRRGSR
jgi:endonuclease/exonuclease/phosphatase family metal-dependent hydrolase